MFPLLPLPSPPPMGGLGWIFMAASAVFAIASLVALWSILQGGASAAVRRDDEEEGSAERQWWTSDAKAAERPGIRAIVEELIWLAVPVLLLIWLWRAI